GFWRRWPKFWTRMVVVAGWFPFVRPGGKVLLRLLRNDYCGGYSSPASRLQRRGGARWSELARDATQDKAAGCGSSRLLPRVACEQAPTEVARPNAPGGLDYCAFIRANVNAPVCKTRPNKRRLAYSLPTWAP